MASYLNGGPLWGPKMTVGAPQQIRRQSWATATWTTGQSIISGMLSHRKDSDVAQNHRGVEYQSFRDEILMPPAYESIVPRTPQAIPHAPQSSREAAPASAPRHQAALGLPPLPRLLGVENLDEWDDILTRTLRLHGLAEYITAPYPGVPEPPPVYQSRPASRHHSPARDRWDHDRAAVCLLMVGSFSTDVRDTLLVHGYDPAEEDPRAVHDLVLEALPRAAGEDAAGWLRELGALSPSDARFGGSLRAFCLRLQYLRRRLYQAEPQPNDNLVLVMAVLALARCERYQGLSMTLGRELERGGLSWARLMGDLSAVHGREVREKRMKRWKAVDDARS